MTKRIFRSILLAAVGVFLAAVALFLWALYDYFSGVSKAQLKTETELAAKAVSDEGVKFFDGLKTENYRITLISGSGEVLFDTDSDAGKMENHSEREEFKEALESGFGESSRYSATLTERYFYCAKRLPDGEVLRLSAAQNSLLTLLLGMASPICAVLGIALILSAALASRLSKRIVKPLLELNLDEPLNNDCYDELSPALKKLDAQQKKIDTQREELRLKKAEFEAVTNGMNEGLILLGKKSEIISANRAASRILGIKPVDVSRNFLEINRSAELVELLENARRTNCSKIFFELDARKYQISASSVKQQGGSLGGTVLLLLDVTEKEQSEQLRREFTANVSHELKTPLQTIAGASELLKNGLVKPSDVAEFSERIHFQARRMIDLVDDIIKLSRLDEGAEGMEWEEIDLFDVCTDVINSLRAAAVSAEVSLKISGESLKFRTVPQLLHTIVYNLCDNAVKYNKKGGLVEIGVARSDGGAVLSVSDTGMGIPSEEQERIFERFYRVDKSRSKAVGGTGLGLSIVKHAARILCADLNVSSVPAVGTTITVSFPL